MKALTIRNVNPKLARALERETRRRQSSLNQTVLDLLGQALGVGSEAAVHSNGLRKLASSWSEADLSTFEKATAPFEQIDEELWK